MPKVISNTDSFSIAKIPQMPESTSRFHGISSRLYKKEVCDRLSRGLVNYVNYYGLYDSSLQIDLRGELYSILEVWCESDRNNEKYFIKQFSDDKLLATEIVNIAISWLETIKINTVNVNIPYSKDIEDSE